MFTAINDHFTKLIKLYAIKDRKTLTASACLHDHILTYGIPSKILTDRDPFFESKVFQELCNSLGIKKLITSGYNPGSNRLTEQSNHTTKYNLTAFVTENRVMEVHDTRFNDSLSNDARFMHKLRKHVYFI